MTNYTSLKIMIMLTISSLGLILAMVMMNPKEKIIFGTNLTPFAILASYLPCLHVKDYNAFLMISSNYNAFLKIDLTIFF